MFLALDPLEPCRVRMEAAPRLTVLLGHLPILVPCGRRMPEGIDRPARVARQRGDTSEARPGANTRSAHARDGVRTGAAGSFPSRDLGRSRLQW